MIPGGRGREGGVGSTAVVIAVPGSENFQARSRLEKESATSVSASNVCAGAWTAFETSTWVQHLDGLAAWCELVRFFAPMQPHAVRLERLRLLFAARRAAIWVEAAAGDRRDLIEAFLARKGHRRWHQEALDAKRQGRLGLSSSTREADRGRDVRCSMVERLPKQVSTVSAEYL